MHPVAINSLRPVSLFSCDNKLKMEWKVKWVWVRETGRKRFSLRRMVCINDNDGRAATFSCSFSPLFYTQNHLRCQHDYNVCEWYKGLQHETTRQCSKMQTVRLWRHFRVFFGSIAHNLIPTTRFWCQSTHHIATAACSRKAALVILLLHSIYHNVGAVWNARGIFTLQGKQKTRLNGARRHVIESLRGASPRSFYDSEWGETKLRDYCADTTYQIMAWSVLHLGGMTLPYRFTDGAARRFSRQRAASDTSFECHRLFRFTEIFDQINEPGVYTSLLAQFYRC